MKFGGAGQRVLNTRTDVLHADVTLEFRLFHELFRLFAGATQEQMSAGCVNLICEITDRAQAGRVDCRHVPEAQHNDRGQLRQPIQDFSKLVG